MRVLVTINCRWWNASSAGAVAQAVSLAKKGHTILVQTGPDGSVLAEARKAGLDTEAISLEGKGTVTGLYPFRRLVREFTPDVICAHRAEGQTTSALVAADVPLVRIRSDIRPPRGNSFWKFVDSRTDLVVFPGEFMIERGFHGQRSGPVTVIPHPVDTDFFSPSDEKSSESSTIVSIARLSPVKGHRTLIRSLSLLPLRVNVLIGGSPAQQTVEQLMSYAAEIGVADRTRLLGKVKDVRPLLSSAYAGVVTSLGSEVVSRAGMEIMSSGLPLLAAATNGLPDLVRDGVTGLLHPPGNHEELARQAGFLYRNPSAAARLGGNARQFCMDFLGFKIVGEMWEKTLSAVIAGEQLPLWRVSPVSDLSGGNRKG